MRKLIRYCFGGSSPSFCVSGPQRPARQMQEPPKPCALGSCGTAKGKLWTNAMVSLRDRFRSVTRTVADSPWRGDPSISRSNTPIARMIDSHTHMTF